MMGQLGVCLGKRGRKSLFQVNFFFSVVLRNVMIIYFRATSGIELLHNP